MAQGFLASPHGQGNDPSYNPGLSEHIVDVSEVLSIVLRVMHILAAGTAIGGTVFMRVALVPAAQTLADPERRKLLDAVRSRWAVPVMISITALLVSGLVNLVVTVRNFEVSSTYHMLFGIKFLLALGVFYIASTLVGRSQAAERFRQQAGFWLAINTLLISLLVVLSAVLRSMDKPPKATLAPALPAQTVPAENGP